MISPEVAEVSLSVAGTFISVSWLLGRTVHGAIHSLNKRIDELTMTIATLDKNLAVQSTILQQLTRKAGL